MEYVQQGNPSKHLAGISFVMLLHIALVYGLMNGLARKVVEVVKGPMETRLIEEFKKAPPPDEAPPPPKLAPPPPPYIPPPEVNVAAAVVSSANTISALSRTPVPPPVAAPAAPTRAPLRVPPVIDAKRSCSEPEYPSASRRLEEEGTVQLRFLIDLDGRVVQSSVEVSSGYGRLDEAARQALSRCVFKPGTVDGRPEQSWASLKYTWKLN